MTRIRVVHNWRDSLRMCILMIAARGDDAKMMDKVEAELFRMAALADVAEKLLGPVEKRGKQRKDVADLLKLAGEPIFHRRSSKRRASSKNPRHEATGWLPGLR